MIHEHSNAVPYSEQKIQGIVALMLLETEGKFQQNADPAHRTIIYWPVTKHLGGHQFYTKKFRSLISAMPAVKTLPRKSLHCAIGLCYK
jgi:hypothetical protein